MSVAAQMTWDDIKALVAELAVQSKETDRRFQETDRRFQDTERLLKERSRETDRKIVETGRQLQETRELIECLSRENAQRMRELDRQLGQLGNRLGEFVQEMVRPALVQIFQSRGLRVHRTMRDMVCRDDGGQLVAQVDLLVIDNDTAIAVECKSHLSVDDVNEHLDRLDRFKPCWPEYRNYRLLGAVAAMVVPDEVAAYAYRKGLFVMAPSGDTMQLRNDQKFEPRVW